MGRKPNPVVAEYFDRGERVQDSSNRYEYTCKACHAHFPRGRQEYLTQHLLNLCPSMSDDDRARAAAMMHDPSRRRGNGLASTSTVSSSQGPSQSTEQQPLSAAHLSALETLAEVSRQQLGSRDSNDADQQGANKRTKLETDADTILQERLLHEMRVHVNQSVSAGVDLGTASAQDVAAAASAASGLLPHSGPSHDATQQAGAIDPSLGNPSDTAIPLNFAPSPTIPTTQPYPSTHRMIPANPSRPQAGYLTDFRLATSGNNGAPRSRFTQERRAEVRHIRKLGACLRCRMLKKPCSPGDPCETCGRIEAARLWKRACVRGRLADELDVFDTGEHKALAQRAIEPVRSECLQEKSPRLRLTLHEKGEDTAAMTLPGLKLHEPGARPPDYFASVSVAGAEPLQLIDMPVDSLRDALDNNLQLLYPAFILDEADPWMHLTLQTAASVAPTRQTTTLQTALRLWTAIELLTSQEHSTSTRLTLLDRTAPDPLSDTNAQDAALSQSASLIALQLNEGLEQLASSLTRDLATDMDHRLQAQRRQRTLDMRFEELLACTLLFASFEKRATSTDEPALAARCDAAADLLTMLLKVRAVPSATTLHGGDGQRRVGDAAAALHGVEVLLESRCRADPNWMSDVAVLDEFVTGWMDAARVRADADGEGAVAAASDTDGAAVSWQGRFVRRLLLP